MNGSLNEPFERDDQINVHLERLVDGEMSPDEYRKFVASLEDVPDGWRRCALSFLESQAFSHDLEAHDLEAHDLEAHDLKAHDLKAHDLKAHDLKDWVRDSPGDEITASSLVVWRLLPRRWLELALVATVSFALAWGSSIVIRSWWPASDKVVPLDRQLADHLQETFQEESSQYVSPEKPLVNKVAPGNRVDPRSVRLVVNGREMKLPVVDVESNASNMFDQRRSMIPDEVVHALERLGHRVQRSHHYIPLESLDGQELVVPVEDVEIVPVSNRAFQ